MLCHEAEGKLMATVDKLTSPNTLVGDYTLQEMARILSQFEQALHDAVQIYIKTKHVIHPETDSTYPTCCKIVDVAEGVFGTEIFNGISKMLADITLGVETVELYGEDIEACEVDLGECGLTSIDCLDLPNGCDLQDVTDWLNSILQANIESIEYFRLCAMADALGRTVSSVIGQRGDDEFYNSRGLDEIKTLPEEIE